MGFSDRGISRRRWLAAVVAGSLAASDPRRVVASLPRGSKKVPEGFDRPDSRGEAWGQFTYQGKTIQCPVPEAMRQRNTDGSAPGPSDGLCVVASNVTDGRFQRLQAEMTRLWAEAKNRPGGYWPERLKKFVDEVAPGLDYLSYEGDETDWMVEWIDQKVPVAVTMGTGRGYQYQSIAHMVSLVGLWRDMAAIVDNNFPDWVAWMPRAEFDRRFVMGGYGWGFLWKKLPDQLPAGLGSLSAPLAVLAGAALGVAATGFGAGAAVAAYAAIHPRE